MPRAFNFFTVLIKDLPLINKLFFQAIFFE